MSQDEDLNDTAQMMAEICNDGRRCMSPIYCGCPFRDVKEQPKDCKLITKEHWLKLMKLLATMEGSI